MTSKGSGDIAEHAFMLTLMYQYCKSDVTLVAGKEFKVHEFVLASQSDFFKALFRSKLKESKERRINLPDIASDTLVVVLNWLYRAPIKDPIEGDPLSDSSTQKFKDIVQAFDFLQIKSGCGDFCGFVEKRLQTYRPPYTLDGISNMVSIMNEVYRSGGSIDIVSLGNFVRWVTNSPNGVENLTTALTNTEDPNGRCFQAISLALVPILHKRSAQTAAHDSCPQSLRDAIMYSSRRLS
ncbi:hypothetical protein TWF730_009864 [Orbilia blumenaviensis]|uniref:BTB domain-containing protein n=1 Tax=Orbilia blumenaviensis TaxID=1796055 RepID=A0AAV9UZM1_9PEZI